VSPYIISEVRSKALTDVLLKIDVFWDVVLCHRASSYQHFVRSFKMSRTIQPTIHCHIPEELNFH